mgnify:CR=1 FL=1
MNLSILTLSMYINEDMNIINRAPMARMSLILQYSLSLLACLLMGVSAYAQNGDDRSKRIRHEISLGCGYGQLMSLGTWADRDDEWQAPSLHLQYLYNVNRHIGIGFMMDYARSSWSKTSKELVSRYDDQDRFIGAYIKETKEHTTWLTFSPTVRIYWFNRDYFAMYSRMSLGILTANGHDSITCVMPTFSPISMEWGSRQLRFFTEILSVGSLGLINGGLKYSF